jgi:hypothetical protein
LLYTERVTEAAAVFGLGFLCFIYANVSRFKRFKGLGFEAELWEDKQKEAADLIDRLREVVSIYTREIVLGNVKSGRWPKSDCGSHWQLYNDLVAQHNVLGQRIDFSGLKNTLDSYFLLDMTIPDYHKVREALVRGKSRANEIVNQEFGSPIRDADGYGKRLKPMRGIQDNIGNAFEVSSRGDLAGLVLRLWHEGRAQLERHYDVKVDMDTSVLVRLERLSELYQSRPVEITDELISWANREE